VLWLLLLLLLGWRVVLGLAWWRVVALLRITRRRCIVLLFL
jgi:hypothetical protein